MSERPASPPAAPEPAAAAPEPAAAALAACPYLVSVDGPWHGTAPSRAHRCRLLASGRQTLDRQREHCLTASHASCPTWLETHGDRGPRQRQGPFVSMAPIVLEGAGLGHPSEAAARRLVGPATVIVVVIALGAFVLARGPLTPGSSGAGDDGASPTPAGTIAPATATPSAAPTVRPTVRPSERPTPTPNATPTPRPRTYKVKSGDTLSAIAARFGTTVAEIAALNKITNPSFLRVGQVLKLP